MILIAENSVQACDAAVFEGELVSFLELLAQDAVGLFDAYPFVIAVRIIGVLRLEQEIVESHGNPSQVIAIYKPRITKLLCPVKLP
jgi:hypothetical protein